MKLYSWNVNGIRAAARKGFLEWLNDASPDILCLQETKAWKEQLDESLVHPPGYLTYWHSAEKKGYSSVATYSKTEPLDIEYGIGDARFDCEGRVLITHHPGFKLFNIYFPNGQRDHARVEYKLDFYRLLLERLNREVEAGVQVIIAGDWNTAHAEIDLKNPKTNHKTSGFLPEERAMLDVYIEAGYLDTFRHFYPDLEGAYSWWSYRANARARNVGWRIDYFFVNQGLLPQLKDAGILPGVMGSDHCPVFLELKT